MLGVPERQIADDVDWAADRIETHMDLEYKRSVNGLTTDLQRYVAGVKHKD